MTGMIAVRYWRGTLLGIAAVLCSGAVLPAGVSVLAGESVVVVFNRNVPALESVAEHYAARRRVPKDRVLGLDLPGEETISRLVFRERLQQPLAEIFRGRGWFGSEANPAGDGRTEPVICQVKKSLVRYRALCYGVPLRVQPDGTLEEEGKEGIRVELWRDEAAVDSELALLPGLPRLYGPLANPVYGTTNAAKIRPENGILMVGRLDGPSPEIAKRLVERAMAAEVDGLWGRAYVNIRGLAGGEYQLGDDWIARAANFSRQFGIETYVDREAGTFPESLPLSHIGLHAGWYETHVSGPFCSSGVEFMPGAVADHLHSFSAQTVRSKNSHWVGPLLEAGAAATIGCVYEPYLWLSPNLEVFFARLFSGFSFGGGRICVSTGGVLADDGCRRSALPAFCQAFGQASDKSFGGRRAV